MSVRRAFLVPLLLSVPVLAWAADAAHPTVIAISEVQGTGLQSPMVGQRVTVEGVAAYAGNPGTTPTGLYLQSVAGKELKENSKASNAIYTLLPPAMKPPERETLLRVTGTVAELGKGADTMTALVDVHIEARGRHPLLVDQISFSDRWDKAGLEALEGKNGVYFLTVLDANHLLDRGELMASLDGRLFTPTEIASPGADAREIATRNAARTVIVDDALDAQAPASHWYLTRPIDGAFPLRTGTGVAVKGVLVQAGGRYRLLPSLPMAYVKGDEARQRRPAPDVAGNTRIAGLNVLNLFNGDGKQGDFPTSRGAETFAAYQLQQQKIVASVQALKPDVAALMEIENDGTGPDSALAQFVAALNAAGPIKDYRFVDSGQGPGKNPIRVALIYRGTRIATVGKFATLEGGPFVKHSRVPLAQAFRRLANGKAAGKPFVVVANHFKSKGCGKGEDAAQGPEADQKDEQGCWNATRVESAKRVDAWMRGDPTGTKADRLLLVGDFNAYAKEDPITTLLSAGWQDALALAKVEAPYSFVYNGQSGRLDHALLSPALAGKLRGAAEWHNNADESERFAYNGSDPDPGPYRASDHDPILLGFDLD